MTSIAPSWVVIDSTSGVLNITAPDVTSDIEYDFYINAAISGVSSPVQKLIKLTILNWSVSNWQKCLSTSTTTCDVCNSGYAISNGEWVTIQQTKASETAQALSTTITSISIATAGCVVLASILNTSSVANLWLTMNQLQISFYIISIIELNITKYLF